MVMVQLTEQQCKVLAFIVSRMEETGMPPTLREIAGHFGWKAVGSAQDIVQALRKKELLQAPEPGKSRQLVPTPQAYTILNARGPQSGSHPQMASPPEASVLGNALPEDGGGQHAAAATLSTPKNHDALAHAAAFIAKQRNKLGGGEEPKSALGAKATAPRPEAASGASGMGGGAMAGLLGALDLAGFFRVPVLGLVQAGNPMEAIENAGEHVLFQRVPGMRTAASAASAGKPAHGKAAAVAPYFSVVVEGYSMMNAGFLPGDYLLIESAHTARNGDIVLAALRDHEVTVKRFALKGSVLYRQAQEKLRRSLRAAAAAASGAGTQVNMQNAGATDTTAALAAAHDAAEKLPPALLVPENPDFEPMPFGTHDSHKIIGLVRSLYRREVM